MAGYAIELLKTGKRVNYYLFLPEDSGSTFKSGVLRVGPTSSHTIILAKRTGKDGWVEAGIRVQNSRVYFAGSQEDGDYAIMIDSSALSRETGQIEVYSQWSEQTKKGLQSVEDVVTLKIVLPKDAEETVWSSPPQELLYGPYGEMEEALLSLRL